MILIEDLRTFIENAQNSIAPINRNEMFIDDSQLAKILRDFTTSQNILLAALVPSHDTSGINIDNILYDDHLAFLLLAKRTDKPTLKDVVDNVSTVQACVKQFVNYILEKASDGSCSIFRRLDINSISIDPIWDMAQCDGYSIEVKTKTNI